LYNGRLITEGEYFGYFAEGKGLLASLVGELHLNFCVPVPTKTDWIRDSEEWYEVEEAMEDVLAPIIKKFRESVDKNPVSREEKKRANEVHRQLEQALKLLARQNEMRATGREKSDSSAVDAAGRQPAESSSRTRPEPLGGTRGPTRNPTPPPPGSVGVLHRLVERSGQQGGLPRIRPAPMEDPSLRSGRDQENGSEIIVINTLHAMYRELNGHEAYFAETAVLEILRPQDDEPFGAEDYWGQALQLLNAWFRVVGSKS
jgi:hypothetical protein